MKASISHAGALNYLLFFLGKNSFVIAVYWFEGVNDEFLRNFHRNLQIYTLTILGIIYSNTY